MSDVGECVGGGDGGEGVTTMMRRGDARRADDARGRRDAEIDEGVM